jgi:hypothetical protein
VICGGPREEAFSRVGSRPIIPEATSGKGNLRGSRSRPAPEENDRRDAMADNLFLRDIPLSISQVEQLTGVNKPTLRYWEKTFQGYLDPCRSNGGQRVYTMEDVRKILEIKKLLRIEMYTILGARRKLGLFDERKEDVA